MRLHALFGLYIVSYTGAFRHALGCLLGVELPLVSTPRALAKASSEDNTAMVRNMLLNGEVRLFRSRRFDGYSSGNCIKASVIYSEKYLLTIGVEKGVFMSKPAQVSCFSPCPASYRSAKLFPIALIGLNKDIRYMRIAGARRT